MASRYWGLNRGEYYTNIVEQSSTPSKDLELKLDLTKAMTREDVLIQLEQIMIAIKEDKWPPA